MDWSDGYVTEIGYLPGYIQELNPNRARLALLMAGIAPPKVETACELGFGQGVSLAVHAAASDTAWWGCDFNPSHAANAQRLASASGARVEAAAQSFAEFCARPDLPEFDFIGLHGVWSWVDPSNRAIIADFLTRKLRVGGVAYVSYNTYPGWAAFAPVRHLIHQHVQRQSAPGDSIAARLDAALAHVETLIAADPAFFRSTPLAEERFKMMRTLDKRYLIHELMTQHWTPLPVSEMASTLEAARLSYAGSAHPLDHVGAMNLSPQQIAILEGTPDPIHRETLRDLFVNQQFRRDLWVKGPTRLDTGAAHAALAGLEVEPLRLGSEIRLKARAGRGEIALKQEAFGALSQTIGARSGCSIAGLMQIARTKGLSPAHCLEAIALFVANGDVGVAQAASASVAARAQSYNAQLCAREAVMADDDLMQLACPRTGGGAPISKAQALILHARALVGTGEPAALAEAALAHLRAHGRTLKRGANVEAERTALIEAVRQTEARLSLWRGLGALPEAVSAKAADSAAA
jgi:hypothetical protein